MKRHAVTINGRTLNCAQWAKELGITRGAISFRMHKYGETAEEAVSHFYHHTDTREITKLRIRLACAEEALATIADSRFIASLEFLLDIAKAYQTKFSNAQIRKEGDDSEGESPDSRGTGTAVARNETDDCTV